MARLPDITYGGVPDEVSPALGQERAAVGQLSDVVQQGLTAYGTALVQAQTQDAHLHLAQGLDDITTDLKNRKAIPVSELKQRLGDKYEQLPDEVKAEGAKPVPLVTDDGKPQTDELGAPLFGEGQVPTFMVAHDLFQARSKEALDAASQQITLGGWQSAFQRAATGDIIAKGAHLNDLMLEQMHQYTVDKFSRQALQYAYAGDFQTAHQVVESRPDVFGKDLSLKLKMQIGGLQQTKPIYDALKDWRLDPESPLAGKELKDAALRLADQSQVSLVDPQHQASLARQVHAALKQVEGAGGKRTAAGLAVDIASDLEHRDPDHPDRIVPGKAMDALDAQFAKGGKYADRPELRLEAGTALQKLITERNERVGYEFDSVASTAMSRYLAIDGQGKYHPSSANLTDQDRAALAAIGKKGEDLLHQFHVWDQAEESHARQAANLPTPAESAKALAIEYALATRGKDLSAKGPGYMARILAGDGDAALGIPPGTVSSRDVPQLSGKFAGEARPEKRQYLIKPETVAFEEALNAFPTLKAAVQKRGNEKGALQVTEGVRNGVRLLSDKLAKYIDDNPGPAGRGPDQDAIRAEARRLLGTVEVKRTILGIPLGTKKIPRVQAEAEGKEIVSPTTLEVPEGAKVTPEPVTAPRSPSPTGAISRDTAAAYVDRSLADGSMKLDGTVTRDDAVAAVMQGRLPMGTNVGPKSADARKARIAELKRDQPSAQAADILKQLRQEGF